jgi:transposase
LRPRRFLFIGDRGLVSQENLDFLESRQLGYLLGAKLRDEGLADQQVLSLRGRYRPITDTLGVKETTITEGGRAVRYLLCRDEDRAQEDRTVRDALLARLQEELSGSRTAHAHTRKACKLLSTRGYSRYLTETATGGLRIDPAKVRAEERLDGKYVLMTNELEAPAEELVLGYRDMWRAERAFRSMKSTLEIEPVYHRAERRIAAHAHLCVLAYLLIRLAENRGKASWSLLRQMLEAISLARLESAEGVVHQVQRLRQPEVALLNRCRVAAPPKALQVSS